VTAARSFALWWLLLFGLWVVLVGANEEMELGAGAGAAAVAALLVELLRRQRLLAFAPPFGDLAPALAIPWHVVRDFGYLTAALVLDVLRVRRVASAWVAVPLRKRADGATARQLTDNVSPNTLVANFDGERRVALKHDLVPQRASRSVP
jgi:hypothetical protein